MPTPTSEIRLWGIGTVRTLRPHWMLCELGIDYRFEPILTRTRRMDDPDFVRLSKRRKIPLFEEGPLMIGESAAIVMYLSERFRDLHAFAPPKGTPDGARNEELILFAMSEMDAPLYIIRRHEGLPDVYGESEVAVRSARDYFLRSASEIERRLDDGRPYLMGDRFQTADLIVGTCLGWAALAAIELPTPLGRYLARLTERPAYLEAMARNFPPEAIAALRGEDIT